MCEAEKLIHLLIFCSAHIYYATLKIMMRLLQISGINAGVVTKLLLAEPVFALLAEKQPNKSPCNKSTQWQIRSHCSVQSTSAFQKIPFLTPGIILQQKDQY